MGAGETLTKRLHLRQTLLPRLLLKKHVDERGEYRMYSASPIVKIRVYLDAWGKAREGLGLVLRKS